MKTRNQKSRIGSEVVKVETNGIHVDKNRSKFIKRRNEMPTNAGHVMEPKNIKNIPYENSINSTMSRRKEFGKPVIIPAELAEISFIRIPNVLRVNKKSETTHMKNKILNNFISKTSEHKLKPSIIIGASIVPQDIKSNKKMEKPLKTKLSNGINELMNLNESCVVSVENDTLEKSDAGPLPHFYSLRDKVICVMEPQCKFSFHGKLRIKVLYGGVIIYGATVRKSNTETPIEVYSSRDNNLINIQTTTLNECHDNSSSIWNALKQDNIDCNVSNRLQSHINNVKEGWAIMTLQNFENNLTTFLEANCNFKLFPKIDDISNYSWSDIKRAEMVLQTNIYCDSTVKQTINFSGMVDIIDRILVRWENNKNSKIIMAGGKNVGKSTSMRYAINRILENTDGVIVLDLDLGQAEFTPSGCISLNIIKDPLLGPNFTHLKKPYYQLYIGGVDVTRCLSNYINGINKLVECLNTRLNTMHLPIIVNTMGFCRDVGWDIMTSIIKCIQPTDVIQIISERPKNNFDQLLSPEIMNRELHPWASNEIPNATDYQLHIVKSQAEKKSAVGETWNIEPHQLREIVMLAYLSDINKPQTNFISYGDNIHMNINGIVPYQVAFSAVKLSLGYSATPHMLSVMNGNIVALCGYDSDNEQDKLGKENSSYPEVLIRLPLSTCYGFGILRGVDMEKEKIYINTPLSISELKHVNCLIGCIPVPSGLLQLNRFGVPYTGGDWNLPTSRDSRRGYFRMKYRNDT